MEGFKGTPGPWEMGYDGPSRPIITTADHSMLSISRYDNGRWQSYEREDYDARLIAAAPELGKVSQDALRLIELIAVAAGPNGLSLKLEGRTFEINFDKIRSDLEAALAKALNG